MDDDRETYSFHPIDIRALANMIEDYGLWWGRGEKVSQKNTQLIISALRNFAQQCPE